ncbi:hypothetical protein PAGU2196_50330 [Pseudomonas sp. PAGU 2196]|nr:hypothetical protein PAGU2196_50330 [Pseudomonas sp. PAGU 2196]
MYCLRCELRADQSFDMPPTLANIIFLLLGLVLLFSLVLALCLFEQFAFGISFGVATAVCAGALVMFFMVRKQAKAAVQEVTG